MYVCNKGIGGGGGLQKFFSALSTSVWSKNKGCGEPSPGSATAKCHLLGKPEIPVGKLKGSSHSVREGAENIGCDLS